MSNSLPQRQYSHWSFPKIAVILVTCLTICGSLVNAAEETLSANDQLLVQKLMQLTPANLGFFDPSDPKLSHIAHVGDSVFTLINPAGEKKMASELALRLEIDLNYDSLIAKLNEVKASIPLKEKIDIELLIGQLVTCKSKVVKLDACGIFVEFSKGTAFLAGEERQLWTALHNFSDLIDPQIRSGVTEPKRIVLPFALLDSSGQVVYNSIENPAKIESINLSYFDLGEISRGNSCVAMTKDWISLKLSKKIGDSLKLSPVLPTQDQKLYLVGFPKKTEDRAAYQAGLVDSDGVSLYFTIGKQRANIGGMLELEPCFKGLGAEKGNILYVDGDGVNGLSGAPMVDDKGEVVGIYNYSFPFDGRAIFYHTSYIYSIKGIFSQ